jgi:hypothetical protein
MFLGKCAALLRRASRAVALLTRHTENALMRILREGDMGRRYRVAQCVAVVGLACALAMAAQQAFAAYTPWGLVAHAAIGRIKHLTQKQNGEQAGFDIATVLLSADATKVYATASSMLHRSTIVHVVGEDPAERSVEFSNGQRTATISVTELGPRLSQLMVASAIQPGQQSATIQVVDGILRVCQEMKVVCSVH